MSIAFSNTTTKKGLAQFFEKEIGVNYGDVTGNTDKFLEFAARVNSALDNYLLLWASSAGTWQADDMSHLDFEIYTYNLVSGQRDYSYTNDGNSNRIYDISKVLILPSATATTYKEVSPVDELETSVSDILVNTVTGIPYQYGKISNTIFFDPIPNYNATNGVKMVGSREGSYFSTGDETKVPGVPVYHEYFYLKPAYEYASIYGLSNLKELEKKVIDLEGSERLGITGKIKEFFGERERDVRKTMTNEEICFI